MKIVILVYFLTKFIKTNKSTNLKNAPIKTNYTINLIINCFFCLNILFIDLFTLFT